MNASRPSTITHPDPYRGHHVEYAWSLTDGSMKAECTKCRTYFTAHCQDATEYHSIRAAQRDAIKPFFDWECRG